MKKILIVSLLSLTLALIVWAQNYNFGTVTVTNASGTGNFCLTTNCAMTTPNLGTPSAINLTNATNVPAQNWSTLLSGSNSQTGAFSTAGSWTFSTNGAASTPGMTFSGTPFTGGSGTTTFPLFYMNSG